LRPGSPPGLNGQSLHEGHAYALAARGDQEISARSLGTLANGMKPFTPELFASLIAKMFVSGSAPSWRERNCR
jgi:hypothetical protein